MSVSSIFRGALLTVSTVGLFAVTAPSAEAYVRVPKRPEPVMSGAEMVHAERVLAITDAVLINQCRDVDEILRAIGREDAEVAPALRNELNDRLATMSTASAVDRLVAEERIYWPLAKCLPMTPEEATAAAEQQVAADDAAEAIRRHDSASNGVMGLWVLGFVVSLGFLVRNTVRSVSKSPAGHATAEPSA